MAGSGFFLGFSSFLQRSRNQVESEGHAEETAGRLSGSALVNGCTFSSAGSISGSSNEAPREEPRRQVNQKAHTLIDRLMPHTLFILCSHQPAAEHRQSQNAVCAGDASLMRMGSDMHRTRCVPQPAPVAGGLSIPAPSAALAQWQRP